MRESSDGSAPDSSGRTHRLATFFAKILAIYGVWYVVYDLWLLPAGWLDEWVSLSVARWSADVLSVVGFEAAAQGRSIVVPGAAGVRIVNGCNGLSTIGLFMGFVLAFPGKWSRRLLFLPLGMVVIYASNVARVSLLTALQKLWPGGFDIIHSLGAPTFFYLIVFALWVLWANYGGREWTEETSGASPESTPSSASVSPSSA